MSPELRRAVQRLQHAVTWATVWFWVARIGNILCSLFVIIASCAGAWVVAVKADAAEVIAAACAGLVGFIGAIDPGGDVSAQEACVVAAGALLTEISELADRSALTSAEEDRMFQRIHQLRQDFREIL